jgi:energy-coupling factor transporter ATP-binding protein EcfA2
MDKDVADFPGGYETVVGERGITLSGGQKQRTALARAVAIDPRILILDDALSAVDTYTEEEILSRLRGVMRQRTSLSSHRVSTVRETDLILVLAAGRVPSGARTTRSSRRRPYADLHRKRLLGGWRHHERRRRARQSLRRAPDAAPADGYAAVPGAKWPWRWRRSSPAPLRSWRSHASWKPSTGSSPSAASTASGVTAAYLAVLVAGFALRYIEPGRCR